MVKVQDLHNLTPLELTFGIELDPNSHFKMVSETILDPLMDHPPYFSRTKPISVGREVVYWEVPHRLEIVSRYII